MTYQFSTAYFQCSSSVNVNSKLYWVISQTQKCGLEILYYTI